MDYILEGERRMGGGGGGREVGGIKKIRGEITTGDLSKGNVL